MAGNPARAQSRVPNDVMPAAYQYVLRKLAGSFANDNIGPPESPLHVSVPLPSAHNCDCRNVILLLLR